MGIIRRGVLQVMDRLYDLAGGPVPTIVDVDSPVISVHDVSREAELGARPRQSGYIFKETQLINGTAGAATIRVSLDLYGLFNNTLDFRSADHRLWFCGAHGSVANTGAGNWTRGGLGIFLPGSKIISGGHWNDDETDPYVSGGGHQLDRGTDNQYWTPPLFCPPKTVLNSYSTSTDDCNMSIWMIWWAGPIGVTPPSMY